MTEAEIMNCAAIIVAGIMANPNGHLPYDANRVVNMMEDIAKEISKRQVEEQRKNEEWI